MVQWLTILSLKLQFNDADSVIESSRKLLESTSLYKVMSYYADCDGIGYKWNNDPLRISDDFL